MVIEAHGGRIGVTGAESGGSEFWFSLPAVAAGRDGSPMK
jgi:signal transduction histidine kinase